jgi:hypothetical protein
LLSASLFGQQAAESKPAEEKEKKETKRVEVRVESLGNVIVADVNGEVRQFNTGNIPDEIKQKLPKGVADRLEVIRKVEVGKGDGTDGKMGITITVVDADGKKETREIRLDGLGVKALAIGEEIQAKLAEQGQVPEAAQKALKDALTGLLSHKGMTKGMTFVASSSTSEVEKKLDRVLEKLEGIEKRLQALEGKRE